MLDFTVSYFGLILANAGIVVGKGYSIVKV